MQDRVEQAVQAGVLPAHKVDHGCAHQEGHEHLINLQKHSRRYIIGGILCSFDFHR